MLYLTVKSLDFLFTTNTFTFQLPDLLFILAVSINFCLQFTTKMIILLLQLSFIFFTCSSLPWMRPPKCHSFSWLYRKMEEPVIYIDPQKAHDLGQELTLQKYKKKSILANE